VLGILSFPEKNKALEGSGFFSDNSTLKNKSTSKRTRALAASVILKIKQLETELELVLKDVAAFCRGAYAPWVRKGDEEIYFQYVVFVPGIIAVRTRPRMSETPALPSYVSLSLTQSFSAVCPAVD
jgi:hypothetical protein